MKQKLTRREVRALPERVLSKFVPMSTGCWEWRAWRCRQGYGHVGFKGKVYGAHRLVYELLVGPIPAGLSLDHLCRNTRCVNPKHLEPVTHRENVMRGVGVCAINAKKTHCVHGHEFNKENTGYTPSRPNYRYCKSCHAADCIRNRKRIRDAANTLNND